MKGLDPDLRSLQEVRDSVERAYAAHQQIARASQDQIDRICAAMVAAIRTAAHDLAKLAVEETGIGQVHYKILKNLFAAEGTWDSIRDEKTCGIISRNAKSGVVEIATPVGVVAGIVPTTNPTSTAIFKALIAVKGRNAMVLSPHPRARRCIGETVEVLRRAIERAGAPPDLVCCLGEPTIESTGALMKHKKVALILATGGSGLVRAAYSSGKPAFGVGPGNVPCYVDRSARIEEAARWITSSQSFDNATFCCSEQALVLDRPIAEGLIGALQKRGAHLCNEEETRKLSSRCNVGGHMSPDIVGQDPWRVAELAGFRVPRETTILLAHQDGVGRDHPLSIEILCPLLSIHTVEGPEEGCETSIALLKYGGLGHTLGVWAEDESVLEAFFLEKPASRIVVNGPTSQGAVGYSTNLVPSVSLGCGPLAGNITSDNISARHLLNIKRAAFRHEHWDTTDERDHARAARWSGDSAPRGSGLPGDPAGGGPIGGTRRASLSDGKLELAPRERLEPISNWRGNPPSLANAPTAARPAGTERAPEETPRQVTGPGEQPRAPRFMAPDPSKPGPASAAISAASIDSNTASGVPLGTPPSSHYVGMALAPAEIEGILAHAGSGCPLGPCQGCPHSDTLSGACKA